MLSISLNASPPPLDGPYDVRTITEDLTRPTTFSSTPEPGKVFMDQIANTKFFPKGTPTSPNVLQGHAVYLPTNWEKGKKYPVIFEYLGNTVQVQSLKGIGYGLSGEKDFIWVILPIVSAYPSTQPDVQVNWGNGAAIANTVEYAKQAVKEVCEKWGGDRENCILTGNSRGGVACNLIGLYDDEIAALWKAMVPSAHYFSEGIDITGTASALSPANYKVVAQNNIKRLGKISQLVIAEYNTDILSGDPDNQLIPKLDTAGCKDMGEAITFLKLKPVYESSLTKNREFIEKYKPDTSSVTFYPLPWANHGSIYSLKNTPTRGFIRNWIRDQVGLPSESAIAFNEWTKLKGLVGEDAVSSSDPDHDGLSNLMEYATGSDPRKSIPKKTTVVTLEKVEGNDYLVLSYSRNKWALGIQYQGQVSLDLKSWTNVATVIRRVDNFDGTETVAVRDLEVMTSKPRFMRLLIEDSTIGSIL